MGFGVLSARSLNDGEPQSLVPSPVATTSAGSPKAPCLAHKPRRPYLVRVQSNLSPSEARDEVIVTLFAAAEKEIQRKAAMLAKRQPQHHMQSGSTLGSPQNSPKHDRNSRPTSEMSQRTTAPGGSPQRDLSPVAASAATFDWESACVGGPEALLEFLAPFRERVEDHRAAVKRAERQRRAVQQRTIANSRAAADMQRALDAALMIDPLEDALALRPSDAIGNVCLVEQQPSVDPMDMFSSQRGGAKGALKVPAAASPAFGRQRRKSFTGGTTDLFDPGQSSLRPGGAASINKSPVGNRSRRSSFCEARDIVGGASPKRRRSSLKDPKEAPAKRIFDPQQSLQAQLRIPFQVVLSVDPELRRRRIRGWIEKRKEDEEAQKRALNARRDAKADQIIRKAIHDDADSLMHATQRDFDLRELMDQQASAASQELRVWHREAVISRKAEQATQHAAELERLKRATQDAFLELTKQHIAAKLSLSIEGERIAKSILREEDETVCQLLRAERDARLKIQFNARVREKSRQVAAHVDRLVARESDNAVSALVLPRRQRFV